MPKKTATARSRAQRNKPKAQKTFELVRPESALADAEEESNTTSATVSTAVAPQEESKTSAKASTTVTTQKESKTSARVLTATTPQEETETKTQERTNTPTPGSASARLAARRQAAQKLQQRSATALITSEHFAYVRKDLIKIAVFAAVMFTAIITLYLTVGR